MEFSKTLTHWYLRNKRNLPWRHTSDPYFIWMSEIMLQQTRVAQGLPYFLSFTEAFPTVFDLASADEEHVLKLWQGLGYYSRARNLHATAKFIATERNGIFPDNYSSLLKLRGIGEYTAAAIASFCFNEKVPVVDGNVFRVLSRIFGIESDIAAPGAKTEFSAVAAELMAASDPALFNQSIMEFGALQCVPKSPNCGVCPFNDGCFALQRNRIHELPINNKKTKVTKRYFNYIVFNDDDQRTIVQKRTDKGIWHNLYEFPLLETHREQNIETVARLVESENDIISIKAFSQKGIIHKLSHQHLHIRFWKVNVRGSIKNAVDYESVTAYPMPIVLFNFLEEHCL